MCVIPPELVAEVLSWLPVADVIRFKSTCKSWCAIIKDPSFIKLHHIRSIQSNADQILISLHPMPQKPSRFLDLYNYLYDDRLGKSLEIYLPHQVYMHYQIHYNGGLLYLAERGSFQKFVVWNPLIDKGKNFQFDPIQPHPTLKHPRIHIGFGYDAISDDYKAVRVVSYYDWDDEHYSLDLFPSEVRVVSLKNNSCRRVQDWPFDRWCLAYFELPVFFNGALHYCTRYWSKNIEEWLYEKIGETPVIVVFDLNKEEFKVHKIPQLILKDEDRHLQSTSLTVLGGHLSLYINDVVSHEVWILEECGGSYDTWTKLYSIQETIFRINICHLKPLFLSKIDGVYRSVLVQERSLGRTSSLYWYDLQRKICLPNELIGKLSDSDYLFVCSGKLYFSDSGVDLEKLIPLESMI